MASMRTWLRRWLGIEQLEFDQVVQASELAWLRHHTLPDLTPARELETQTRGEPDEAITQAGREQPLYFNPHLGRR